MNTIHSITRINRAMGTIENREKRGTRMNGLHRRGICTMLLIKAIHHTQYARKDEVTMEGMKDVNEHRACANRGPTSPSPLLEGTGAFRAGASAFRSVRGGLPISFPWAVGAAYGRGGCTRRAAQFILSKA